MSDQRVIRGVGHQLVGHALSWAGICPWTGTLALGTEDGRFVMVGEDSDRNLALDVTRDSVNGAAFVGDYGAFTSRESIRLLRKSPDGLTEGSVLQHPYRGGAHGVLAMANGAFLMPVGPAGLLSFVPKEDGSGYDAWIAQRENAPFYGYHLALVGQDDENQIFAVAARQEGIVAFGYDGRTRLTAARQHFLRDQDIIAVCPLNDPRCPRGVAALSRDCRIFLISDVFESRAGALDYPELSGTGYDLFSSQGHLVVLTSETLVTISNLVDDFAAGQLSGDQTANFMEVNAVGMFAAGDDGLYLLDGDIATEYKLSDLVGDVEAELTRDEESHGVVTVVLRPRVRELELQTAVADLQLKAA